MSNRNGRLLVEIVQEALVVTSKQFSWVHFFRLDVIVVQQKLLFKVIVFRKSFTPLRS